MACHGMVWYDVAFVVCVVWCGVAWRGVAWHGVVWRGVMWRESYLVSGPAEEYISRVGARTLQDRERAGFA